MFDYALYVLIGCAIGTVVCFIFSMLELKKRNQPAQPPIDRSKTTPEYNKWLKTELKVEKFQLNIGLLEKAKFPDDRLATYYLYRAKSPFEGDTDNAEIKRLVTERKMAGEIIY